MSTADNTGNQPLRCHRFSWQVAFADTDAGGIVYHARYLDMAERARAAWLAESGYPNQYWQKQGRFFPVVRLEIDYHTPAQLDDILHIDTRVLALRGARLQLQQSIYRADTRCVTLLITLACMDNRHKPVRYPAILHQILHP